MNIASLQNQTNQFHEVNTTKYSLCVRQQPTKARLCSFKDKVDRRPLDPPPIVQLLQNNSHNFLDRDYQNSANFFLHATLASPVDDSDIHMANNNRTTAGVLVQSLHKLKDINDTEGAFFIFPDISVRIEGTFKLKFTLFRISGFDVYRVCSVMSDSFKVYPSKHFPGMAESTLLTRSFSDQGVRIRIRKEARINSPSMKRRREVNQDDNDEPGSVHDQTSSGSSNVMSMQNLLINDSTVLGESSHYSPYVVGSSSPSSRSLRQLPSPHSLPFTHSSGFFSQLPPQLPLPRQNLSDNTRHDAPFNNNSSNNRYSLPDQTYRST